MTSTLLLLLKGPMQSWGDDSRYKQRKTGQVPTKSGVIGMLAAALGRRRVDPIEDLAGLSFGVRVDQPGTLLKDFQTALPEGASNAQLVTRYFLSDAVFVVAVESEERALLENIESALRRPRFPLFLGRRSCPAPADLVLGIRDSDLVTALQGEEWHASKSHRQARARNVVLPIHRDARKGERGIACRDVPISFAQEHRQYAWREVVQDETGAPFENPLATKSDPFFEAVIRA